MEQRAIAVEPKLMLQQDIARIIDERINDLKIYSGRGFVSSRERFPPLFSFEHVTHRKSALRSQKTDTFVAELIAEIARIGGIVLRGSVILSDLFCALALVGYVRRVLLWVRGNMLDLIAMVSLCLLSK